MHSQTETGEVYGNVPVASANRGECINSTSRPGDRRCSIIASRSSPMATEYRVNPHKHSDLVLASPEGRHLREQFEHVFENVALAKADKALREDMESLLWRVFVENSGYRVLVPRKDIRSRSGITTAV